MLKVQKDDKIMEVTQRAYDVLYKQRGFKVIEEKKKATKKKKAKDLTLTQWKEMAKEKEIEGYYRMDKEELLKELE